MEAALEKLLHPFADDYLGQQQQRLSQEMAKAAENVFIQVKDRFQERMAENFATKRAALEGNVPVEKLLDIQRQLA